MKRFYLRAEFATTENINFMAMHAKGLICMPMSAEYVKKLHFPQMVETNTDNHETAFTVSVDYVGTTTGISAAERSMTAMRCVAEDAKPEDSGVRDICFRFWKEERSAGEKRAYGSNRGSVPPGRLKRMWALL